MTKRRNSIIRMHAGGVEPYVEKTYHSKYRIAEEVAAYERLAVLLAAQDRIRSPEIFSVNERGNSMRIELIDGPNLAEQVEKDGIATLDAWRHDLLELFIDARRQGIHFDADPTNCLIDTSTGELVIVDPVCMASASRDFVAVVFLWGLSKAFLRFGRMRDWGVYRRCWKTYLAGYLRDSGAARSEFNAQMSDYLREVIGWNLHDSGAERWWRRGARVIVAVPFLWAVRIPFAMNWVGR